MTMTREEANDLVEMFGTACLNNAYYADRSDEFARNQFRRCEEKRQQLKKQFITALCADPNAEAIDKLRQAALGALGLIALFPVDKLTPPERGKRWQRLIVATENDLKEALKAAEEG